MYNLAFRAYCSYLSLQTKAINKLKEERGDTNFLSIIIVLAIVLVLAIVFIAFKDKIIALLSTAWSNFETAFKGQTSTP